MGHVAERTLYIRKTSTISYSRACHGRDARDGLEGGTGCGQSSTLHTMMHIGGMVHQRDTNNNNNSILFNMQSMDTVTE